MKNILIIANGDNNLELGDITSIFPVDLVICVDGGTSHAINLGIYPDVIIGDLDSLSEDVVKLLKDKKIEWKIYPKEKDETDLELGVKYALKYNPEKISFIGLLGKRIDHTLANIFFLERIKDRGIEVEVIDKNIYITLLKGPEKKEFWGNLGGIISLIPLSDSVEGITLKGLKYTLNNEPLYRNLTRGISNEFIEEKAIIEIKSGTLIVIMLK